MHTGHSIYNVVGRGWPALVPPLSMPAYEAISTLVSNNSPVRQNSVEDVYSRKVGGASDMEGYTVHKVVCILSDQIR